MGAHIFLLCYSEYKTNSQCWGKYVPPGKWAWQKKGRFCDVQCTPQEFIMIIEESFPLLNHAGGFKLMRCCRSRLLMDIAMPPEGYSVIYLKERSSLNKAVAYIVPLQWDLPLNGDNQKVSYISYFFVCIMCSPLYSLCDLHFRMTVWERGNLCSKHVWHCMFLKATKHTASPGKLLSVFYYFHNRERLTSRQTQTYW